MRIFCDTASLIEIEEWAAHPWVSGFTTNPTLFRQGGTFVVDGKAWDWAREAVRLAAGKPISIDGPAEVWGLGRSVWRKLGPDQSIAMADANRYSRALHRVNWTAIVCPEQLAGWSMDGAFADQIVSVFAGRIMDTGRDPQPVIDAAKATGAQVLWASVREPYNIVQAEAAGCDIITVPPAILRKYLDWHGKPLEAVGAITVEQFDRDREGLW